MRGAAMKPRFSSQDLFEIRNNIPIERLLMKLQIPSKTHEGFLRFACPQCSEMQTAVNPRTNLARCFRCQRNFNTIELVMVCRNLSFVAGVEFLRAYRNTSQTALTPGKPANHPARLQHCESIKEILKHLTQQSVK